MVRRVITLQDGSRLLIHIPELLLSLPASLLDLLQRLRCFIGLLLGVLLVGSIGWLMLFQTSGRALLSHFFSAMTGRTLSIDVSQPTVVDRIQRLQRLETVVYNDGQVSNWSERKSSAS